MSVHCQKEIENLSENSDQTNNRQICTLSDVRFFGQIRNCILYLHQTFLRYFRKRTFIFLLFLLKAMFIFKKKVKGSLYIISGNTKIREFIFLSRLISLSNSCKICMYLYRNKILNYFFLSTEF